MCQRIVPNPYGVLKKVNIVTRNICSVFSIVLRTQSKTKGSNYFIIIIIIIDFIRIGDY